MGKFEPGKSGNPGGRPKGKSLTALLNKYLGKKREGETKTIKQELVEKITDKALEGDMIAMKYIMDRHGGKSTFDSGDIFFCW